MTLITAHLPNHPFWTAGPTGTCLPQLFTKKCWLCAPRAVRTTYSTNNYSRHQAAHTFEMPAPLYLPDAAHFCPASSPSSAFFPPHLASIPHRFVKQRVHPHMLLTPDPPRMGSPLCGNNRSEAERSVRATLEVSKTKQQKQDTFYSAILVLGICLSVFCKKKCGGPHNRTARPFRELPTYTSFRTMHGIICSSRCIA